MYEIGSNLVKTSKHQLYPSTCFAAGLPGSPRGVKHTHPGGEMNKHVLFAAFVHC